MSLLGTSAGAGKRSPLPLPLPLPAHPGWRVATGCEIQPGPRSPPAPALSCPASLGFPLAATGDTSRLSRLAAAILSQVEANGVPTGGAGGMEVSDLPPQGAKEVRR